MFSVMQAVLLEPLPYRDPDRVIAVWETARGGATRNGISAANFVAWRERARTLEHLGMVGPRTSTMVLDGDPVQVAGLNVSSDVYDALAVRPALGRPYSAAEDGSRTVVILSHEFWQRALGGRADVLGVTLTMDGDRRLVIGVMPPRFTVAGQNADFLVPFNLTMEQFRGTRGRGGSYAVARLREGVSFAEAYTEMRAVYAALEKEVPDRNAGRTVMLFRLGDQMVGEIRPALLTLTGAVVLVLLVACVNVASLVLARSAARRREVGMRAALGAGRGRLVRQMLTESLVLAAAGGVAGLGVAAVLHRGLILTVGEGVAIPRLDQVTLDWRVLLFTVVVTMVTAVAFGLIPALMSVKSASDALREGGRHAGGRRLHRVLNALVVTEVAVSLVLLVGAGLLLRSFANQRGIDTGYRTDGVLLTGVQLPAIRYDGPKSTAVVKELLTRLSTMPGVQDSAVASCLPPPSICGATSVWRLDRATPPDGERQSSQIRPVSPAFFRTMAIPHLAGRDFTAHDTADSSVAIVSESVVRDYFAGENPLGVQLHINNIDHANGSPDMPWTVIGVVRDIRSSVDGTASRIVYVPITQMPSRGFTVFVRSHQDAMGLAPDAKHIVRSMEPEAPLSLRTLDDVVAGTIARPRAILMLVGAFAVLALALAGIGVYGVIAYLVRERTRELGVRMALGATATAVGRMVVGHALRLGGLGVVAGLILAAALTRLLERLLFQVDPLDPWILAAASVVFLIVAALASYVPARRGMHTAPADVLRAM
jgi:putative ABC transport system permease protein